MYISIVYVSAAKKSLMYSNIMKERNKTCCQAVNHTFFARYPLCCMMTDNLHIMSELYRFTLRKHSCRRSLLVMSFEVEFHHILHTAEIQYDAPESTLES